MGSIRGAASWSERAARRKMQLEVSKSKRTPRECHQAPENAFPSHERSAATPRGRKRENPPNRAINKHEDKRAEPDTFRKSAQARIRPHTGPASPAARGLRQWLTCRRPLLQRGPWRVREMRARWRATSYFHAAATQIPSLVREDKRTDRRDKDRFPARPRCEWHLGPSESGFRRHRSTGKIGGRQIRKQQTNHLLEQTPRAEHERK